MCTLNPSLPGSLCQEDYDLIQSWTQDVILTQALDLNEAGAEEERNMGARFRNRLPELFDQAYDQDKIQVQ